MKWSRTAGWLAMLLVTATAPGRAAAPVLEQEVIERNPGLKAARQQVAAAEARIRDAGSWEDPRLGASGTSAGDLSVKLSQELPVSGRLAVARELAGLGVAMERERLRRRQLDVLMQLRVAVAKLQRVAVRRELNQSALDWIGQARRIASDRYANNAGGQSVVLTASATAARLEAERSRLVQEAVALRAEINALRDCAPDAALPAGGMLSGAGSRELPGGDYVLQGRPEVRLARLAERAARSQEEWVRRVSRAEPELEMGLERRVEGGVAMDSVMVGMSIGLPWLNPGRYGARRSEARALALAAAREREAVEAEARRMHAESVARSRSARERRDALALKALPAARQAFDAALAAYGSGAADYAEVSEAFRLRLEAEGEVIEAAAELAEAEAGMRALAGDPVSGESQPPAAGQ